MRVSIWPRAALRVLHGLLRSPVTDLDGAHYRLTGARCEPAPLQDPLPILIGGSGEKRMLRIVAEYADASCRCRAVPRRGRPRRSTRYREIGLDELIIPDGLLGAGSERRRAMDVILGLVRD